MRLFKLNKTRTIFGQFEFLWMNSEPSSDNDREIGDVLLVTHLLRYSAYSVSFRRGWCGCELTSNPKWFDRFIDGQLEKKKSLKWRPPEDPPREFCYINGQVLCWLIFQPVVVFDLFSFLTWMCVVVSLCFPWVSEMALDGMTGGVVGSFSPCVLTFYIMFWNGLLTGFLVQTNDSTLINSGVT